MDRTELIAALTKDSTPVIIDTKDLDEIRSGGHISYLDEDVVFTRKHLAALLEGKSVVISVGEYLGIVKRKAEDE